jgi:hypothetical protein
VAHSRGRTDQPFLILDFGFLIAMPTRSPGLFVKSKIKNQKSKMARLKVFASRVAEPARGAA